MTDEFVSLAGPSAPIGYARVEFARTSEPPCFSVIAMPIVNPCLRESGTLRGSRCAR